MTYGSKAWLLLAVVGCGVPAPPEVSSSWADSLGIVYTTAPDARFTPTEGGAVFLATAGEEATFQGAPVRPGAFIAALDHRGAELWSLALGGTAPVMAAGVDGRAAALAQGIDLSACGGGALEATQIGLAMIAADGACDAFAVFDETLFEVDFDATSAALAGPSELVVVGSTGSYDGTRGHVKSLTPEGVRWQASLDGSVIAVTVRPSDGVIAATWVVGLTSGVALFDRDGEELSSFALDGEGFISNLAFAADGSLALAGIRERKPFLTTVDDAGVPIVTLSPADGLAFIQALAASPEGGFTLAMADAGEGAEIFGRTFSDYDQVLFRLDSSGDVEESLATIHGVTVASFAPLDDGSLLVSGTFLDHADIGGQALDGPYDLNLAYAAHVTAAE